MTREAEVDVALTGTFLRAGDHIVSVQLVEGRTGTVLWSLSPQVDVKDVFELQDQIVDRIVESLSPRLTTREQALLGRDVPRSPTAYEYYLRGNQIAAQGLRGGESLSVARELYQRSVEEDPAYAPAWARLGRCVWLIAKGRGDADVGFPLAEGAFQKALELNPELPLGHNLYAHFQAERGQARSATERLLRRAAHGHREPELFAALVQTCRFSGLPEASLAAHRRVRELDPQLPTSANHTLWQLGDLEGALKEMNKGTFYLDAITHAELLSEAEALRAEAARDFAAQGGEGLLGMRAAD